MPPTPNPQSLHQALTTTHPLNWGTPLTTTELTHRHGADVARRSLELLEQAAAMEPIVTGQFLDSLPSGTMPYQLDRRVKSPDSLARKLADWEVAAAGRPIDDILRYTVLTENPDELVAAARRTVDALNDHDWRVRTAMHSYTDGSRYKGVHAGMTLQDCPRVEVQFHSVASARVKEATTSWYEIERSWTATVDERTEARRLSAEASNALEPPPGIDTLTELGGTHVAVNNYSDSRQDAVDLRPATSDSERQPARSPALDKKTDGMTR